MITKMWLRRARTYEVLHIQKHSCYTIKGTCVRLYIPPPRHCLRKVESSTCPDICGETAVESSVVLVRQSEHVSHTRYIFVRKVEGHTCPDVCDEMAVESALQIVRQSDHAL